MKLSVLLLLVPFAIGAEEWSRFRGPNGSGISPDPGFPVEFSGKHNVLWRTAVRGGKSSPVLTGSRIFLTGFENGKLYTQCFDRHRGKLLWERAEARPRAEFGNVRYEPACITPVTDGENVYALFGDYGLISYDGAGNLRWKVPLGPFTNTMGMASSPILAGDFIIVVADQQDDSYMAAFDRRNGEIRWKTARPEKDGWGTPVLFRPGGAAFHVVTASRGQLGAHRVPDGARAWSYDHLSPAIVASPVLDGDTVFTFGYGNESAAPFSNVLEKYDRNHDGQLSPDEYASDAFLVGIAKYVGNRDLIVTKEKWDQKQREVLAPSSLVALRLERDPQGPSADAVRPRELWRYEKSFVGVVPSPLYYDGVVYVVKNGGILTAFDAKTGAVTRAGRIPGAIGGYSASPVAAAGKIYLASEDGKVTVLRAGREWEVLTVNDLDEPCYATPALSGGTIYLRSADALYGFGQR